MLVKYAYAGTHGNHGIHGVVSYDEDNFTLITTHRRKKTCLKDNKNIINLLGGREVRHQKLKDLVFVNHRSPSDPNKNEKNRTKFHWEY